MANWYDNYTFPFTTSTFDTYVKENLANLGVSENDFFNVDYLFKNISIGIDSKTFVWYYIGNKYIFIYIHFFL